MVAAVHGDGAPAAAGLILRTAGQRGGVRGAHAFGHVGAAELAAPGRTTQPLHTLGGGGERSHLVRSAFVEQVPQGAFSTAVWVRAGAAMWRNRSGSAVEYKVPSIQRVPGFGPGCWVCW